MQRIWRPWRSLLFREMAKASPKGPHSLSVRRSKSHFGVLRLYKAMAEAAFRRSSLPLGRPEGLIAVVDEEMVVKRKGNTILRAICVCRLARAMACSLRYVAHVMDASPSRVRAMGASCSESPAKTSCFKTSIAYSIKTKIYLESFTSTGVRPQTRI